MDRNREDEGKLPFHQDNISSSSLEGMERPVRSFKSFIKTAPPLPREVQKPLPSTPSTKKEVPSPPASAPSTPLPALSPGSTVWKAPVEWYNSSTEPKKTPPLTPLIPTHRKYSPLLPESSPDVSDIMKMKAIPRLSPSPPVPGRPRPIYEWPSASPDLVPPKTPPKSPLPAIPTAQREETEDSSLPNTYLAELRTESSSPGPKRKSTLDTVLRIHTLSPTDSTHASVTSPSSTKEKALLSLRIASPWQGDTVLENKAYNPKSIPLTERPRTSRQYVRGKKLYALDQGSPLSSEIWEDIDMDDKMQQLSFSQDYHSLLVDQYRELNRSTEKAQVPEEYLVSQLGEQNSQVPPKDHLVPRPLSWQKVPGQLTSHNSSGERAAGSSTAPESRERYKSITSWVPHQLCVRPRRQSSGRISDEISENKALCGKSKHISEAKVDKVIRENDFRFSTFFPSTAAFKFGKKKLSNMTTIKARRPLLSPPSPPPSFTPLIRLPGGLAIVRHPPAHVPKSEVSSMHQSPPTNGNAPGNFHLRTNSTVPSSEQCSCLNTRDKPMPTTPAQAVQKTYHNSFGSSNSKHSMNHEVPRNPSLSPSSPLPLPPSVLSSSSCAPPLSPDAWKRLKRADGMKRYGFKTNIIEKAKEARRRHYKQARQERLKQSIKVLGPTDPGVVAYVGGRISEDSNVDERSPGYMAGARL